MQKRAGCPTRSVIMDFRYGITAEMSIPGRLRLRNGDHPQRSTRLDHIDGPHPFLLTRVIGLPLACLGGWNLICRAVALKRRATEPNAGRRGLLVEGH